MPWCTFRVRRAAAIGAIALAAAACAPSTSSPPSSAAKPGGPLPEPTAVAEGQALIAQKGCGGCHTIPGIPGASGAIGPNLAGVASRSPIAGGAVPNTSADDLKRWILDVPIVCTLDAPGLAERVAEFARLFGTALVSHKREPAQLRLVLAVSKEGEAAVRDLFRRENECCQFFSFAIHRDERGLVVTMGVPHGAEPTLDGFETLAARTLQSAAGR